MNNPEYHSFRKVIFDLKEKKIEFGSAEHVQQVFRNLQSNRKYLDKLNSTLFNVGIFIEKFFPNIKTNTKGRIKSISSSTKKLANYSESTIYDFVGFKTIIESVNNRYTTEDKLRESIAHLQKKPITNVNLSNLLNNLQTFLQIKLEEPENKMGDYPWNSFYDFEDDPVKIYRNADVLVVDRLNAELEMLKTVFDTPVQFLEKLERLLKQIQTSTTYGISLKLSEYMKKYIPTLIKMDVIDRIKPGHKIKENGYVAEHLTIFDKELELPIEYQIRSLENDIIAKYGLAAHQGREGKQRKLDVISIPKNLTDNIKTKNLISLFSEKFINDIMCSLPRYTSYIKDGKPPYTYTPWENFLYFYLDQLQEMTSEQRNFYDVGLQLHPDFQHREYHFADEFPYNALPEIYKEAERRQEEKDR